MATRHPKRRFLEEAGALHRHPGRVRAELFERHRFFDPLDKVQVKYEMLRTHAVEGRSVVSVAEVFGFSRETFYAALAVFEERGIPGLADGKPGRPGPLKLTEEAAQWVRELHRRHPELSGREIGERLVDEMEIEVHRRTIERLLGGAGKKTADCAQLRPERRCAIASSPFLTSGGTAQCRYERLRDYMLTEPADRPRTSPAQFDLRRFQSYGLLGLVDGTSLRRSCGDGTHAAFEVQLIAMEAEDARDRWARLFDLLARAVSGSRGGDDAAGGTVCQGLDGLAGEGTDDPEPARRHYGLR